MNITKLTQLRDHLKYNVPDAAFNMTDYFVIPGHINSASLATMGVTNRQALEGSCGSAACIAGHAMSLFEPNSPVSRNPDEEAAALLGLEYELAFALFMPIDDEPDLPDGLVGTMAEVTIPQAVKVLDHLIATGEVDWRVAQK